MNNPSTFYSVVLLVLVGLSAVNSSAEDVYYVKPLADVNFVGEKPKLDDHNSWTWGRHPPHAAIEGNGEAFVDWLARTENAPNMNGTYLALRLPADRKVEGRLYLPGVDAATHTTHRFVIPAGEAKTDQRNAFLKAKRTRYLTYFPQVAEVI